jgi:sigma-54 dependent transcriptional regulator of gfr operon
MPLGFFKEVLDYELPLLENDYGLKLLGNSIIIFTHYFFNKQYEEPDFNKKELEIIEKMSAHFIPVEDNVVQFVEKLLQTVGLKLDMKVDNVDRLFVYVYLSSIRYEAHKRPIRAIILAHGYSTASSIADVVNKMFGQQVFDAMDMKVNVSVKQIGRELSDYIEQYTIEKGLLLLVDMGSLEGITSFIDKEVDFPIGIIDGVSTQMALDVAEHIQGRKDLESILQDINKLPKPKTKLIYPQGVKKNLIIASCITGIGTADRIKELLKESMPQSKDLIINAYEFEQINQESFMQDIQKIYNVLVIIGTFDPHVDGIPYIPLEDLISGKKIDTLGKVLSSEIPGFKVEKVNQGLMRNFSLERVLNSVTILDVHTIMENVDTFVRSYETLEQNKLSNPVRMAIYVHVSCLLERLIRNTPIDTYAFIDDEQKDIRQTESFKNIKKAFSVIEQIYSVTIPDSEVGYIFDIVNQSANIPA